MGWHPIFQSTPPGVSTPFGVSTPPGVSTPLGVSTSFGGYLRSPAGVDHTQYYRPIYTIFKQHSYNHALEPWIQLLNGGGVSRRNLLHTKNTKFPVSFQEYTFIIFHAKSKFESVGVEVVRINTRMCGGSNVLKEEKATTGCDIYLYNIWEE